jgi:Fe2+-dicitrate sensor, membrane component
MDTPYNLILRFINNECTVEEVQKLIAWRQASYANETTYQELLKTWRIVDSSTPEVVIPNKQKVWNNIQSQIENSEEEFDSSTTYSRKSIYTIASFAASVALIIGIALTFLLVYKAPAPVSLTRFETQKGDKSQMILPDGTKVWLNSGSQLTYRSDYNREVRTVLLSGEAFFDVVKNPDRPFIVKSGGIDVKVLGTAFDVCAYPEDNNIAVSLLRGKVSIESSADQNRLALLYPNEKAVINKANMLCNVTPCDASTESIWLNHKLRFEGTKPDTLFKQLNRWYGVNFAINKIPKNTRYWLTLKSESLTETLQLINKITPIHYSINGEEVTIEYK